jgi:hypothetical protein
MYIIINRVITGSTLKQYINRCVKHNNTVIINHHSKLMIFERFEIPTQKNIFCRKCLEWYSKNC